MYFYDEVSLWHPSWPNWLEEALAAAERSSWVGELAQHNKYLQATREQKYLRLRVYKYLQEIIKYLQSWKSKIQHL